MMGYKLTSLLDFKDFETILMEYFNSCATVDSEKVQEILGSRNYPTIKYALTPEEGLLEVERCFGESYKALRKSLKSPVVAKDFEGVKGTLLSFTGREQ